jgi:hypothetical protein
MRTFRPSPGAETPVAATEKPDKNVRFSWGVKIPMRDGVLLNASLYRPRGRAVAAESGKDARTAHVTLYHDAEHPSCLELPWAK